MHFAATATECLVQGVSVEIVGRPGSGRSILLDNVAAALQGAGRRVVRVRGIGALRGRPMGALLPSVPGLGRQSSIADAVEHLTGELAGGGFLVVDDADDLDDVTAGVLLAVRGNVHAPLLIGRRTVGRPIEHVRRLIAASAPGIRHVLRPLTFDALREMLEAHLGGPVDCKTMAGIATMSGGLPGLARTIALVSRVNGTLTYTGGAWTATGPLWSAELGQAVDALLLDADDGDVQALTLLAVAGPFRADDARTVIDAARLERLCELGLLDVVDGADGGSLGLYPPVIGEYLREQCTASTRMAVRETIMGAGLPLAPALRTEHRGMLEVDDALVSHTLADHQTATTRTLLATWQDAPTATNAAPLLQALIQTNVFVADAAEIRERTVSATCPDEAKVQLETWYAVHRWLVRRDPADCAAILDAAIRAYPAASGFARSARATLQMFTNGITERHTNPSADEVPTGGRTAAALAPATTAHEAELAAVAQASAASGRTRQALATLHDLRARHPFIADKCRVLVGVSLLLDGRVDEAERWASLGHTDAQRERNPGPLHGHGYVTALAAAVQGRLTQAERVASLAMTMTAGAELHAHYLAGVAGIAAARRRWLGLEPASTAAACDPRQSDKQGIFPFAFCEPGCNEDRTCDTLWCHAENAARKGYHAAAAFAVVEAAEHDRDSARLARIEPFLHHLESEFLTNLVHLARAVVDRDPVALARVRDAFASRGIWLYAVRAGLQRACVLRESGDNQGAAQEVSTLWATIVPHTDGIEPLFARYAHRLDLSPRELEIARHAVDGRTAVDIAAHLVLSVRTVEHHLLHAYRKVGVDCRDGLRRAFRTWLRSAHDTSNALVESAA